MFEVDFSMASIVKLMHRDLHGHLGASSGVMTKNSRYSVSRLVLSYLYTYNTVHC